MLSQNDYETLRRELTENDVRILVYLEPSRNEVPETIEAEANLTKSLKPITERLQLLVGHGVVMKVGDSEYRIHEKGRDFLGSARRGLDYARLFNTELSTSSELPQPGRREQSVPPWFPKAGAAFAGVGLSFFMILAVWNGPQNRSAVIFVLALTMSFVAFFFGATVVAQGTIPIPYAKTKPITFSAAGGVATFIVVLLLANFVYGNTENNSSEGSGGGTPPTIETSTCTNAKWNISNLPPRMREPVDSILQGLALTQDLTSRGSLKLDACTLTIGKPGERVGVTTTIAVHTLTLLNGTRIITNGNDLDLKMVRLDVSDGAIESFPPDTAQPPPASSGANGTNGLNAGRVQLAAYEAFAGDLVVRLHGQNGGAGGSGSSGARGLPGVRGASAVDAAGSCQAGGQDGGQGKPGGPGGRGLPGGAAGNGGDLLLAGVLQTAQSRITFQALPGNPGVGGGGGEGGVGGPGGAGGRGSVFCGGGQGGAQGPRGLKGVDGLKGAEGKRGIFRPA